MFNFLDLFTPHMSRDYIFISEDSIAVFKYNMVRNKYLKALYKSEATGKK